MKRKFLIALLAVVSAVCCAVGFAACEDNKGPGGSGGGGGGGYIDGGDDGIKLDYQLNTEGTYTITGIGDETADNITIPADIDGTAVTAIAEEAFIGNSTLTGVTISNGITSIGIGAFVNCSNLKSVSIPGSVTEIGGQAFMNTALINVTMANGVTTISTSMFENCTKLETISIPDSVTTIGLKAFNGCSRLKNVNMGSGVKEIGNFSFSHCDSLKNLTFGSGVQTLGNYVLAESGIRNLVVPNSVVYIGESLLYYCFDIESISVPFIGRERLKAPNENANPEQGEDEEEPFSYTHFGYLFGSKSASTNHDFVDPVLGGKSITVKITDATDKAPICSSAFYNTVGIGTVIVQGGMTKLLSNAFGACSLGTNFDVVLPSTLKTIDGNAFLGSDVGDIYFEGSQSQWNSISGRNIAQLRGSVYYYAADNIGGNVWHYDENGKPAKWN